MWSDLRRGRGVEIGGADQPQVEEEREEVVEESEEDAWSVSFVLSCVIARW